MPADLFTSISLFKWLNYRKPGMGHNLKDLIDITLFQSLQDNLEKIHAFPSAIIDTDGNILTASPWQDVCTKFHRANPLSEKECIESDKSIFENLQEANPTRSYKCPHGLIGTATPIILNGEIQGAFITGQFFLEKPDLAFFSKQAQKYGFDEPAYLAAVSKVPVWSNDQLEEYLSVIKSFTEILFGSGSKNQKKRLAGQTINDKLKTLRENEERYRHFVEADLNGVGIHVSNLFGKILLVNDFFLDMIGYSRSEFENGRVLLQSVTPEEWLFADEIALLELREKNVATPYEKEYLRRDGIHIPVFVTCAMLPGSKEEVVCFVLDMTEQKKAELGLLESEDLKNSLLQSIPFAMDIVDSQGTILFINDNLAKEVKGNPIGQKCWSTYRDDKLQCSDCPLVSGINIGKTDFFETSGLMGGRTFQISHTGMMFKGKMAMLEIFQDVTEKREIEKKVRLLAKSLESISECVYIADMNDQVIYVNESLLRTYGYQNSELIGKKIGILRPQELEGREVRSFLQKTVDGGWRGEIMNRRKDGTLFPVLLSSSVIKDDGGNLIALIGVAIDITEMRKSRAELMEAKERAEENERLRAALLNNMSHEIRTPMNAIMGFSDLMKEADPEEKNAYAEIINSNSNQLLSLIDEVILLSRLQSEKIPVVLDDFCPSELVSEIAQMFNHPNLNQGLEIRVQVPKQFTSLNIQTDLKKVRQVLTNFLSNALKYTFEGTIELGFDVIDNVIEFYVKDTGMGIPEQESKLIFEAFYRGEKAIDLAIRGSGLGLNIAKELIELMGGKIGVHSVPNVGSYFYFMIPFQRSDHDGCPETYDQKDHHGMENFRILIADDEHFNARFLEILLKGKVKSVDIAINGKEAVEMATKYSYDLVLMDLKMPIMDGIEATKAIKAKYPGLPIIAQTACSSPEERNTALQAGCDDLIVKPINKEKMMEMIGKYVMVF